MPREVATIAKEFMHEPAEITVGTKNSGSATVSHEFYVVNARDRYEALKRLADANPDIFSVIFCRTKRDTQAVAEKLIEDGYNAAALHGDLSQGQREKVLQRFKDKKGGRNNSKVRLFLGKGRKDSYNPRMILDLISKETDVSGRMIDDIRIMDNFSFFTTNGETADIILEVFRRKAKADRNKPLIEKARERN